MDAAIYDESPHAEYLEGSGEAPQSSAVLSNAGAEETASPTSFAPRRLPSLSGSRFPNALTKPLHVSLHKRTQTWDQVQDVCSSAIKTGITRGENNRFLDQLRYLIIASQLLVEQSRPTRRKATPSWPGDEPRQSNAEIVTFSVNGVVLTAASSFVIAWALSETRASTSHSLFLQCLSSGLILLLLAGLLLVLRSYAWRHRSKRIRQEVVNDVSALIAEAQSFDDAVAAGVTFVQEIEVVARGYEINRVLPPISRLEDNVAQPRCSSLRQALIGALTNLNARLIGAHQALQTFAIIDDIERYYEIYDISASEIRDVLAIKAPDLEEQCGTLKHLRYLLRQIFVARQVLLCDLLAIPPQLENNDTQKWYTIAAELEHTVKLLKRSSETCSTALAKETERDWTSELQSQTSEQKAATTSLLSPRTPGHDHAKAQMRRLDSMSYGVRSLNAKMHLLRDEASTLAAGTDDSSELTSTLAKHYEAIGTELRSLLAEWEKGKVTMVAPSERFDRFHSRSSSGIRSPTSPAASLGGLTAVEGSPADALMALNGEQTYRASQESGGRDEEVFEAVAMPRKPLSMTREEKIAKMQEDRRKRATFHEQSNTNTHMLRELETVIKHRPRGRTTSRITGV